MANKARDLFTLSVLAFKEKQFDNAAKLFTAAMDCEDLDSFVNELTTAAPNMSALTGPVPPSDNTLSPSLASDEDMEKAVEQMEEVFRAECSLVDEGDEEVEVRASAEEDEPEEAEAEDLTAEASVEPEGLHITVSAGPVRVK